MTAAATRSPITLHSDDRGRLVRVLPGDYYVTGDPAATLVTVLGSCVAACVRNPATGFGGLNHFMLPESETEEWNGASAAFRYGNFAMEALINAVLKSGCHRADLEVKLFGGAAMHGSSSEVGRKNAAFARAYLDAENIRITAQDLGGELGRRIEYRPATGRVQRLILRDREAVSVANAETKYRTSLTAKPVSGDIDLFE